MTLLDNTIIKKVLQIPLDKGLDFAEIFCEKSSTTSLGLENNKLEKIRTGIDQGCGLRIIHQNQTYYGYVNSLTTENLIALAQELTVSIKKGTKNKQLAKLLTPTSKYQPIVKLAPTKASLKEKIILLEKANQTARTLNNKIKQVIVAYADIQQELLIANTLGTFAPDQRTRVKFLVQVVAKNKKITETGYESIAANQGLEIFDETKPELVATIAGKRALLNLEAELAPAGKLPVVLAGSAGGTMVHEACGHALEADFIQKGISIFNGQLGKKVVSPLITVIDDGSIPGYYGSAAFDDEGTPTQKNILINKGKLTGYMSDYYNARLLKIKPSGNGRRQSYRHSPIPRMTNTYIAPGKATYQEILSSVPQGILVKKMGGGQVDITNGNFVFEITEGYRLKNGKQQEPIRGATLVGNGIEVLKNVDMVGNDLHFIPGTCGKGQHAPVTDGQPTIHIPEIIIGGHQ